MKKNIKRVTLLLISGESGAALSTYSQAVLELTYDGYAREAST